MFSCTYGACSVCQQGLPGKFFSVHGKLELQPTEFFLNLLGTLGDHPSSNPRYLLRHLWEVLYFLHSSIFISSFILTPLPPPPPSPPSSPPCPPSSPADPPGSPKPHKQLDKKQQIEV